MPLGRKSLVFILAPPLLSAGLVAGMLLEQQINHVKPEDAGPYHARAERAIMTQLPVVVGNWVGTDQPTIEAAEKLLQPNAMITRRYLEPQTRRNATLMIVQTRTSRDMMGHFPPVCYDSRGETEIFRQRQQWQVGQRTIDGVEYHFEQTVGNRSERKAIYNFMVVPRVGILPDMSALGTAARDHQLRYFGAAQVQVLVPADWPKEERDSVFTMLIAAIEPILRTLVDGEMQ